MNIAVHAVYTDGRAHTAFRSPCHSQPAGAEAGVGTVEGPGGTDGVAPGELVRVTELAQCGQQGRDGCQRRFRNRTCVMLPVFVFKVPFLSLRFSSQ